MRMITIHDEDKHKILNPVPPTDWSPEVRAEMNRVWDCFVRNSARMAGLAANQVDVPIRAMAVKDMGMILNPEMTAWSEDQNDLTRWEGCYSIPGVLALVRRPKRIVLDGLDINGEQVNWALPMDYSWIALHELDHLDGVLITDKAIETRPNANVAVFVP